MAAPTPTRPSGVDFLSIYLNYSTEVHMEKGGIDYDEFPDEYIDGISNRVNPLNSDPSQIAKFIKLIKWAIKQKPGLERYQSKLSPSIFVDGDSLIKNTIAHGFLIVKTWKDQFPDTLHLKGEFSVCLDRDPGNKFSGIVAYWNIKFDDTRMKKVDYSTVNKYISKYPNLMIGKVAPIIENSYEEPIHTGEASSGTSSDKPTKSKKT
ncbi:TPA_asm: M [Begonia betacytorhabdovirus 1]|nr:TPA_asm: M [Begonia betacytorhabdovirus 1]